MSSESDCRPSCDNIQGLAACFVCMLIWNFQGFWLQAIFQQWPCTLFASYTSAWFVSIHLIIGLTKSYYQQPDPSIYIKSIICNKKILLSCTAAAIALIISNISSNLAFSNSNTPVWIVIMFPCIHSFIRSPMIYGHPPHHHSDTHTQHGFP